jgi:hypothetical protein
MSLSNKRQKCDLVVVGVEEEPKPETKTKPETETKPEPEIETKPETEPETKPEIEIGPETETEPETKPEIETMKEAFTAATDIFELMMMSDEGMKTILEDKGEVLKEAFDKYDFSPAVNGVLQGNKYLRIASYAACVFASDKKGLKGKGKGKGLGLGRPPKFSVCITPEKQSDTIPKGMARDFNEENPEGAGSPGGEVKDRDGAFVVDCINEFFDDPDIEDLREVCGKGDILKRVALARKFSDEVEYVLGDDEELRTFFYAVTVVLECGCW